MWHASCSVHHAPCTIRHPTIVISYLSKRCQLQHPENRYKTFASDFDSLYSLPCKCQARCWQGGVAASQARSPSQKGCAGERCHGCSIDGGSSQLPATVFQFPAPSWSRRSGCATTICWSSANFFLFFWQLTCGHALRKSRRLPEYTKKKPWRNICLLLLF